MSDRRSHLVDIATIAQGLTVRIEEVIARLQLHGRREAQEFVAFNPTRTDGHLGSFRIHLYGDRQGIWADFAVSGAKGDALDLVAYVLFAGDKVAAIKWAKGFLGLEGAAYVPGPKPMVRDQQVKARAADENPYKGHAQRRFIEARPGLRGTPVELYLAGRGIDFAALGRQPGSLRYHPGLQNPENKILYPAMIASVQDGAGAFVAAHRTWLAEIADGDGEIVRVEKAPLTDAKRTLGRYAHLGGFIPIWRGRSGKPIKDAPADDTVAITEGIEDALTVALAAPELRVLCAITVSHMANVALPAQLTDVLLVADNDKQIQAQGNLARAIAAHRAQGRKVRVARAGGGCKDVNERLTKGEVA